MSAAAGHVAAIALGSNLGDRRAHLAAASAAVGSFPGTRLTARSSWYETAPVGPPGQGMYLNGAAVIRTSLAPRPLLDALLAVERSRGRDRAAEQRWGPRTLDLDLLLYDDAVINEPGLAIPHPRMHERVFVLEPLAEIAPTLLVPTMHETVWGLLARLRARPTR